MIKNDTYQTTISYTLIPATRKNRFYCNCIKKQTRFKTYRVCEMCDCLKKQTRSHVFLNIIEQMNQGLISQKFTIIADRCYIFSTKYVDGFVLYDDEGIVVFFLENALLLNLI